MGENDSNVFVWVGGVIILLIFVTPFTIYLWYKLKISRIKKSYINSFSVCQNCKISYIDYCEDANKKGVRWEKGYCRWCTHEVFYPETIVNCKYCEEKIFIENLEKEKICPECKEEREKLVTEEKQRKEELTKKVLKEKIKKDIKEKFKAE